MYKNGYFNRYRPTIFVQNLDTNMTELKALIESAWENRDLLKEAETTYWMLAN